jgi:hypothetical protein
MEDFPVTIDDEPPQARESFLGPFNQSRTKVAPDLISTFYKLQLLPAICKPALPVVYSGETA